jgi:hypothetical protein
MAVFPRSGVAGQVDEGFLRAGAVVLGHGGGDGFAGGDDGVDLARPRWRPPPPLPR